MYKRGIITICFIFSILLLSSASAIQQNLSYGQTVGASVTVTSLKYEPYPVEPGETFNINLILKNIGTSQYTNDATCKIVNQFPFSAYNQQQQNVGKLAPGREFSLNFQIKVNEKAIEGIQNLEVWCTDDPSKDVWTISKIPIEIQIRYSVFELNITTTPAVMPIGKQSKINIQIKNNAESIIRDVIAELNINSIPISPVNGITDDVLSTLKCGVS